MINRDEITKNIKKLMQNFADSSSDVEITTKSPQEADVSLNGKYFNTYLIKEKRFKNNIIPQESAKPEFKMKVVISRDDLEANNSQYRGAQLQLPASKFELQDALSRARITSENEPYTIKECIMYDIDLAAEDKNVKLDITELNYLAKVMSNFDRHEHELYKGYKILKGDTPVTVKELINLAYNLHCCDLTYELHSDEELGKYMADNDMLPWLSDANKEIWKYLNYALIGSDTRKREYGCYTPSGYFTFDKDRLEEVYNSEKFPEEFKDDEYIFKLLISKDLSEENENAKWLSLPTSKDGKAKFLDELGAESYEDCFLLAVQSIESHIPMCVKGLSQLGILNSLAHRMRDMSKAGELAKYMAVLEGYGFEILDEAVNCANNLDNYELYEKPSTIIEYAKEVLKARYEAVIPQSVFAHINFATFAEEMVTEEQLALSEYGIVKNTTETKETNAQADK